MIDTVIFDLDGVIVDSEPVHQAIEKRLFNELEIEVPELFHQTLVGMNEENLWGAVLSAFNLDIDAQTIINKKRTYLRFYLEDMQSLLPIPDVIPLIKALNKDNLSLVLASSSPRFYIKAILKNFAIYQKFDALVSGEEVSNSKPAPDIFLEAARRIGKEPRSCLVIEDSTNGIKAAKAAGMKVIGFRNSPSGGQDFSGADYIIDSFKAFNFKQFDINE
jgi:HAD superfamily hydrolase (TIGR01509 family)